MIRVCVAILIALCFVPAPAGAVSICDPDGVQTSGSIYRICMPPARSTTASWSSGRTASRMPARRSRFPRISCASATSAFPTLVNGLGFAFATNSYSKTGLAVLQGKDDILDLVNIFAAQKGTPAEGLPGRRLGRRNHHGAQRRAAARTSSRPASRRAGRSATSRCRSTTSATPARRSSTSSRASFRAIRSIPIRRAGRRSGTPTTSSSSSRSCSTRPTAHRLDQWVAVARLPVRRRPTTSRPSSCRSRTCSATASSTSTTRRQTLGGFPFDNRSPWYTGLGQRRLLNSWCRASPPTRPRSRR